MSSVRGAGRRTDHGSLRFYITGFLLALILTALPFWLVMTAAAPAPFLIPAILTLGVAQIGVHLRYFLHINGSAAKRWDLVALVLAAVVAVIVMGGSLWVIHELDDHMMPRAMTMEGSTALGPLTTGC